MSLNADDLQRMYPSVRLPSKSFWMRDEVAISCTMCGQKFSFRRRKHHCRICGRIFCSNCTEFLHRDNGFVYGDDPETIIFEVRICLICLELIQTENGSDDQSNDDNTSILNRESDIKLASSSAEEPHFLNSIELTSPPPDSGPPISVLATSSDNISKSVSKAIGSESSSISNDSKNPLKDERETRRVQDRPRRVVSIAQTQSMICNPSGQKAAEKYLKFDDLLSDDNISAPNRNLTNDIAVCQQRAPEVSAFFEFAKDSPSTPTFKLSDNDLSSTSSKENNALTYKTEKVELFRSKSSAVNFNVNRRRSKSFDVRRSNSANRQKGNQFVKQLAGLLHPYDSFRFRSYRKAMSATASMSTPSLTSYAVRLGSLPLQEEFEQLESELSTYLPDAVMNFLKHLLAQCLMKTFILKVEEDEIHSWHKILIPLISKAAFFAAKSKENIKSHIYGNSLNGQKINLQDLIHVKKIPGKTLQQSCLIRGIVFAKNISLKQMRRQINNPRIMIIQFPIQFYWNEKDLVSLEPIIDQEKEYLQNLIDRIAAFNIDLLFLERGISGLALKMLYDKDITCIHHIDKAVLQDISITTQSDIVSSIDRLTRFVHIGTCESFSVYTCLDEEISTGKRAFVFLEGGSSSQIHTITLYGGSDKAEASKLENLTSFMVLAAYNCILEKKLLEDHFLQTDAFDTNLMEFDIEDKSLPESFGKIASKQLKEINYSEFAIAIPNLIYSFSRMVKFPIPEILENLQLIDKEMNELNIATSVPNTETILIKEKLQSDKSRLLHQWNTIVSENQEGLFSPFQHQSIVILYSLVCTATSVPCLGPFEQKIDYYTKYDCPIGQYVQQICLSGSQLCTVSHCQKPLWQHHRNFVHGGFRISVILEDFTCPVQGMSDCVLMWSYCKHCKISTPVCIMSTLSWSYSFAKYLEISYYSNLHSRIENCPHEMNKDYVRYFGFNDKALRFHQDEIKLHAIRTPPLKLEIDAIEMRRLKRERFHSVRKKILSYFQSLNNSLLECDPATFQSKEAQESYAKEAKDLLAKSEASKTEILKALDKEMSDSPSTDILCLDRILRDFQNMVSEWEQNLKNIEKRLITSSEKDLRKLAAEHLRKLFIETSESDLGDDGNIELSEPKGDNLKSPTSETSTKTDESRPRSSNDQMAQSSELSHKTPVMRAMRKKIETETTGSTLPILKELDAISRDKPDKVLRLARHFDRLSLELEKERLQEESLALSRRNRARKVLAVDSKVRVFENLEEAVADDTTTLDEHDQANMIKKKSVSESDESCFSQNPNQQTEVGKAYSSEITKPEDLLLTDQTSHGTHTLEKMSLMKTILTNYWANHSTPSFIKLDYPLLITEHVFTDSDIILREDEPTSLIAFTLRSTDYLEKVAQIKESKLAEVLNKTTGTHFQYQFRESKATFSCHVYFADQFEALRRAYGCSDYFVQSLSRCIKWNSTGGKSGSAFLKTLDDRIVVKQMVKHEPKAFLNFAPAYFDYMSQAMFHGLPTILSKILGVFHISLRNPKTGLSIRMDVMVMENLFYGRKMSQIYDLKGSMRNRHVQSSGKDNEVLQDENFVEFICESPLFVRHQEKRMLKAALWNDTLFLSKLEVMDYSMIIGFEQGTDTLFIGIIDFISTYTWDKKLESWVKEKGFVGGSSVREPTIITPRLYKNRFRQAMDSYIYGSPDCWNRVTMNPLYHLCPVMNCETNL